MGVLSKTDETKKLNFLCLSHCSSNPVPQNENQRADCNKYMSACVIAQKHGWTTSCQVRWDTFSFSGLTRTRQSQRPMALGSVYSIGTSGVGQWRWEFASPWYWNWLISHQPFDLPRELPQISLTVTFRRQILGTGYYFETLPQNLSHRFLMRQILSEQKWITILWKCSGAHYHSVDCFSTYATKLSKKTTFSSSLLSPLRGIGTTMWFISYDNVLEAPAKKKRSRRNVQLKDGIMTVSWPCRFLLSTQTGTTQSDTHKKKNQKTITPVFSNDKPLPSNKLKHL